MSKKILGIAGIVAAAFTIASGPAFADTCQPGLCADTTQAQPGVGDEASQGQPGVADDSAQVQPGTTSDSEDWSLWNQWY